MKRLAVFLLIGLLVPMVSAQVSVEEAFMAVEAAEAAGADVSGLVDELNQAILLFESGETGEAEDVVEGVIVQAQMLQVRAERQGLREGLVAVAVAGLFVGAAVVVWLRGDRWFWRLWGYTKRGFVVREP